MGELKRVIDDSEVMKEDDSLWPPADRVGRQVSNSQGSKAGFSKDLENGCVNCQS